jgi:hypothetical protein
MPAIWIIQVLPINAVQASLSRHSPKSHNYENDAEQENNRVVQPFKSDSKPNFESLSQRPMPGGLRPWCFLESCLDPSGNGAVFSSDPGVADF